MGDNDKVRNLCTKCRDRGVWHPDDRNKEPKKPFCLKAGDYVDAVMSTNPCRDAVCKQRILAAREQSSKKRKSVKVS